MFSRPFNYVTRIVKQRGQLIFLRETNNLSRNFNEKILIMSTRFTRSKYQNTLPLRQRILPRNRLNRSFQIICSICDWEIIICIRYRATLCDVCIAYGTWICDRTTSLYFRRTLSRATEIPSLSSIYRKTCNTLCSVYRDLRISIEEEQIK